MKKILLASAAFIFIGANTSMAVPMLYMQDNISNTETMLQLAKRGRGGDDRNDDGSSGNDGGGDDGMPDQGSGNDDDGDVDESGSGRKKPRIPGGSGCDDPGDIEEHAACRG